MQQYFTFMQDGRKYDIRDLTEGFVIEGDLDLSNMNLTKLPDLSKVIINGNFNCANNNLASLKGAPKEVRGSFYCYNNYLSNLKGSS